MPSTPSFRAFVLDQLSRVAPDVRGKNMFGGMGIYSDDLFFALIASDALYLKVDDVTRPDFEAIGMGPFRPFGDTGEVMQYYEVSADILEDADELKVWTGKAIAVAERAREKKTRGREDAKGPRRPVKKAPRKKS